MDTPPEKTDMRQCQHFGEKIGTVSSGQHVRALFACSIFGSCVPSKGPPGIPQCWKCSRHSDGPPESGGVEFSRPTAELLEQAQEKAIKKVDAEPVGNYLAEILEWLGAVKSGSCGCAKLQADMNRWGVAGCRKNMGLILEKLRTEAWKRGIPMTNLLLRPLVKRAIKLAERDLANKSDTLSEK